MGIFKYFIYIFFIIIILLFSKEYIFNKMREYNLISNRDKTSISITFDGGEERYIKIDKNKLTKEIKNTLLKIENHKKEERERFKKDLKTLLDNEFKNSYNNIDKFADWFFAYTTQYKILYQGAIGIIDKYRAGITNDLTLTETASQQIRDYIAEHYKDIVLKPNLLEPSFKIHFEELLFKYLKNKDSFMGKINENFRDFLKENSIELSKILTKEENIDWKSNINNTKSLITLKNKKGEGGLFTIGSLTLISAKIGSKVATTGVSKTIATKIIAKTGLKKMIASLSIKLAGGGLTAGIGFIIGGIIDYSLNEADETINRDDFIKDVNQSLNNIKEIIYHEIDKENIIEKLYERDINSYKLFINSK